MPPIHLKRACGRILCLGAGGLRGGGAVERMGRGGMAAFGMVGGREDSKRTRGGEGWGVGRGMQTRKPFAGPIIPKRMGREIGCWGPASTQTRQFHALGRSCKEHHFDTLRVVQRLREEGFTEQQAEGIMRVMSEVIDESTANLSRTMVLKEEQEKITYTQKVDFAKLRSELHSQQNQEFALTRNEYDRLTSELSKLNSRLREEITRSQNAFRLDLNLEKGRIREEASAHELKIKETDTRIEAEVGLLRGTLEGVKFSTLQWLIGVCTGTAALILGIWRLLM